MLEGARAPVELDDCPEEAGRLSRGFSFVGLTLVYARMQAVGMANDHFVDYFRYREIRQDWKIGSFHVTKSLEALKRDKFVIFSAQH